MHHSLLWMHDIDRSRKHPLKRILNELSRLADKFIGAIKLENEETKSYDGKLSTYDGRMAFILCFGSSKEIQVEIKGKNGYKKTEIVNCLFAGEDPNHPLLVQRIGKARDEAKISSFTTKGEDGDEAELSGVKAVPSLGYIDNIHGSEEEKELFEAAATAFSEFWQKGISLQALPLPPSKWSWKVTGYDHKIKSNDFQLKLTANRKCNKRNEKTTKAAELWEFAMNGTPIPVFDGRNIIISNTTMQRTLQLDGYPELTRNIRNALYIADSDCNGKLSSEPNDILDNLRALHYFAETVRQRICDIRNSEHVVFDWVAHIKQWSTTKESQSNTASKADNDLKSQNSLGVLPQRVLLRLRVAWRDALLSLKTSVSDNIVLGQILDKNGRGCNRDMNEGVLLRIWHVLESLYPFVLVKAKHASSMQWQVNRYGAGYSHLVHALETLGEMHHEQMVGGQSVQDRDGYDSKNSWKRALNFSDHSDASTYYSVPHVTTKLWPHQYKSVEKILRGISGGRLGHADASAVGAGKTLTALAVCAAICNMIPNKSGILIMLPSPALIKEWLIELSVHTTGFHVIEQREDGSLFSLTYGRSHPPIEMHCLVLSTLDRVSDHPFVKSKWEYVVVDECLLLQSSTAKRCAAAWREVEVAR